ncbi:hypothetical protein B0H12DRAFT_1115685 [Mycena haematopus]|nr:hypothetical protein B0H12DRAFT_1115685 [Mycena haematopus]
MSREDRRPLSQVPEDSVNFTDMYPLSSYDYAPTLQEPFTLHPPYNSTDENLFSDTYYSSDADMSLGAHALEWAHYQATYAQGLNDVIDTQYPCLSSLKYPELPLDGLSDVPATPDHAPFLFPAQFESLLPDPSNQVLPHFEETLSHSPAPACFHNPDQLTPADVNAILNFPEYFPEFFTNTEHCKEFSVHQPLSATDTVDAVDPSEGAASSPPLPRVPTPVRVDRRTVRRSKPDRIPPMLIASGSTPSDSDDLSTHEKKRLYVECLEQYTEYLHHLFAYLPVQPVPLERVSSYRGLTTRSMRTILIHLIKCDSTIRHRTTQEREKMIDLSIREVWSGGALGIAASPSSGSVGPSSAASADAAADELDISSLVSDVILATHT